MDPLTLFLLLGGAAVAAGIALSRKQVPADVGAATLDMMNRYTVLAPTGERVFKPEYALAIIQTLASQLYSYPNQKDPSCVRIKPDPVGAPPSPDLSALGWARLQNGSHTIMAPVYMAESSTADRFLRALTPGQETSDGGKLYAVLAYPGVIPGNQHPPGQRAPSLGGVTLPTVVTPAQAAAAEIPPDLLAKYQTLLSSGTDPSTLLQVASVLDAAGFASAAELLRKRAASVAVVTPAGPPRRTKPAPAPGPVPSAVPAGTTQPGAPLWAGGPAAGLSPQAYTDWAISHPADAAHLISSGLTTPAAIAARVAANAQQMGQAIIPAFFPLGTPPAAPPAAPAPPSLGQPLWANGPAAGLPPQSYAAWAVDHPADAQQLLARGLTNPGAIAAVVASRAASALGGASQALPQAPSQAQPTTASLTDLQKAAIAMNKLLTAHGYKQSDMPFYRALQQAGGLSPVDGYPGTSTMGLLHATLAQMGMTMANVPVYPWKATGGYDGKNAPTQADWGGQTVPLAPMRRAAPSASAPSVQANTQVSTPGGGSVSNYPTIPANYTPAGNYTPLQAAAVGMNNVLNACGGYRKAAQPVYAAFQKAAGIKPADAFPGAGTMTKLKSVLDGLGIAMANVPVYPWKSSGTYDGKNAPTLAEWNAPLTASASSSPAVSAGVLDESQVVYGDFVQRTETDIGLDAADQSKLASIQAALNALGGGGVAPSGDMPGAVLWPGGPPSGLSPHAYVQWAASHPDQIATLLSKGLVTVQSLSSIPALANSPALANLGALASAIPTFAPAPPAQSWPPQGNFNPAQYGPALLAALSQAVSPDILARAQAAAQTMAQTVLSAPPTGPAVTTQSQVPPVGASPLQRTAIAMNNALATHGYRQADMGLYQSFQHAVGVDANGYPGPITMDRLKAILTAMGLPLAQVPVYPWHSQGSYDGVNAPPQGSWLAAA
jgi:hypothetical protein